MGVSSSSALESSLSLLELYKTLPRVLQNIVKGYLTCEVEIISRKTVRPWEDIDCLTDIGIKLIVEEQTSLTYSFVEDRKYSEEEIISGRRMVLDPDIDISKPIYIVMRFQSNRFSGSRTRLLSISNMIPKLEKHDNIYPLDKIRIIPRLDFNVTDLT